MVMGMMRWFCRAGWFTGQHSPRFRRIADSGDSWKRVDPGAAAMAFGSFSGLDRLMVMSSWPYSVYVFHCISFAMRSAGYSWCPDSARNTSQWPFGELLVQRPWNLLMT